MMLLGKNRETLLWCAREQARLHLADIFKERLDRHLPPWRDIQQRQSMTLIMTMKGASPL